MSNLLTAVERLAPSNGVGVNDARRSGLGRARRKEKDELQ